MKRLIINSDKNVIVNGTSVIIMMLVILTGFYFNLEKTFRPNFFVIFLKVLIILLNLFFLVALISIMFMISKPIAIIDKNGILIQYIGLISWPNVKNAYINTPEKYPDIKGYIAINLKNKSNVKNLSILGRFRIMVSEFLGFPHLTISGTDKPYEEIISFIRKFIKQ